jgi:predicted GIY-YIG superfamily endonuclease
VELKEQYTVYRLYNEEDDLLYVGCTKYLSSRLEQHRKKEEWWSETARIEESAFDDPE